MASWKGQLVESLSISYGFISKKEKPDLSVRELAALADKRMYEAKSEYYRKKGMDRRGNQDAHKLLCQLYTNILKINIADDNYQIVNFDTDSAESTNEENATDKLSSWLSSFASSGQIYPDDLREYNNKANLNFIRDYFAENQNPLRIFYRRKLEDAFKRVMMEIVPANDYSKTNQSLYLYVKQIDR
ncbi:MAG: hypothetical protein K5681_05110 [Treponema sp.]|nr:hypothetical protein [Treponema sp.]